MLALTQADTLGTPVGRVRQRRIRRRQWKREKAAKLAVKILFPLVLFTSTAILVVISGPDADSIIKGLAP